MNQNKSVLGLQKISGKLGYFPVEKSIVDSQEISGFSKKSATRNIKAIASASSEVLRFLSKLFVESVTGSKSYLKVLNRSPTWMIFLFYEKATVIIYCTRR